MKVTLFTSNNHRHNYLVNLLSNFCDELWVVQECKTLFTGKNDEKYQNKNIIFSDWSVVEKFYIKRRDFEFKNLIASQPFSEPNLFSDLGDKAFIPRILEDHKLKHYLKIYEE